MNNDSGWSDTAKGDVSIYVEAPTHIMAERPMCFPYKGVWTGEHDVCSIPPARSFHKVSLRLTREGSTSAPGTTPFTRLASHKTAPDRAGLMYAFTAGWHDQELGRLSDDERRRRVIREVQKYWPEFPDEPLFTECIRWDRAINLESPGQFPAIHGFLKHNARDVKGLYLAGEYLFLIACTEGAFATGEQAANMVMEDL